MKKSNDGKSNRIKPDRERMGLKIPCGANGENHSQAARDKRCRLPCVKGLWLIGLSEIQGGTVRKHPWQL